MICMLHPSSLPLRTIELPSYPSLFDTLPKEYRESLVSGSILPHRHPGLLQQHSVHHVVIAADDDGDYVGPADFEEED